MSKRGRKRRRDRVWRRRTGVIYRPGILGAPGMPGRDSAFSNDGGDDAPLTTRGRALFGGALVAVIAVGSAVIVWVRP